MSNSTPKVGQRWLFRLQQAATFLFLFYVLYLLGRSAWLNTQSNRELETLRTKITELREENTHLKNLIAYEQTPMFRELEARRKLGIKKPGELVVALPPEPTAEEQLQKEESQRATTGEILQTWWKYYTG